MSLPLAVSVSCCLRVKRLFCLLSIALLWTTPVSAIELSGQYSNLLFQTRDSLNQYRTTDLNRLRLQLDSEQEHWRVHVVYDHELLWGGLVVDPAIRANLQRPDATWIDASAVLSQGMHRDWQHKLYRGWVEYDANDFSVKVGRQRIAWGSGRIWNPTDRFNPVQPTALELDQKLGVDAALVQWNYSNTGYLVIVGAPARTPYQTSRKSALRWQDTWGAYDVSMLLGRIGEESVLGFDVTGNLADAGVRMEWMQAKHAQQGNTGQVVLGLDYTWNNAWFSNGLYAAIEYFYNGAAGLPPRLDRLNGLSKHLLGMQLGYDLTALWRAELLFIADLQYNGWFAVPALTWSVLENIDLQAFAQLPRSDVGGEFAHVKSLYAVRVDWYF